MPLASDPALAGDSTKAPMPFPADALLEAIDGVAYVVDPDGILRGFSRVAYVFAADDGSKTPWRTKPAAGTRIFGPVQSDDVVESYRTLHQAVWSRNLFSVGFEYRCDTPDVERRMRMSLTRIQNGATPVAVVYQSIILSETPRAPLRPFAFDLVDASETDEAADPIVRLRSYCRQVAWPADVGPWIEAVECYRRGGDDRITISHCVREDCVERVVAPVVRAETDVDAGDDDEPKNGRGDGGSPSAASRTDP